MTEIRETLRFNSPDLEEMNRVMGRLQDRLDALEGLRGDPQFYQDVDFSLKNLKNVANIVQEQTTTNTAAIETATISNAIFANPPTIPIVTTYWPHYPTLTNLPNSGDLAVWEWINGSVYSYYLAINAKGRIYYIGLLLAPLP